MFREGSQIGQYKLIRKLGKGGFGEVWLAEKSSQFFTKRVAVKLLHDEQIDMETIRREATLWEEASGHPNVLPIIDAEVYEGQVIIVSEYADGGSLLDKLRAEGKLPVRQAVETTVGILNGLEFLHGKKIIHRDIKPANILLQGDTPRLADFGISRAMHTSTFSSIVIGTDAYMAPEAFDGKRNVQTDIWSVGVVLYQLLKGSLPFPQEHPSERMFAVMSKEFAPLPEDLSANLRAIVQKALTKMPQERFQSAAEMREALRYVLLGAAALVAYPPTPPLRDSQPTVPIQASSESIRLSNPDIQSSLTGFQVHPPVPTGNRNHTTQQQSKLNNSIVTKISVPISSNTGSGGSQSLQTGNIQPFVSAAKKRPNANNAIVLVGGLSIALIIIMPVLLGLIATSHEKATDNLPSYSPTYSSSNTSSNYNSTANYNSSNSLRSSNSPADMSNTTYSTNTYAANTNMSYPSNTMSSNRTGIGNSTPETDRMSNANLANRARSSAEKLRNRKVERDDEDFTKNEGRVYTIPSDEPRAVTNSSKPPRLSPPNSNRSTDEPQNRIFEQILKNKGLTNSAVVRRPQ